MVSFKRLLWLIFLFVTALLYYSFTGDNSNEKEKGKDTVLKSAYSMKYDGNCTTICLDQLQDNIKKYFEGVDEFVEEMNKSPYFFLNLSKSQFRILCQKLIKKALQCIERCPSEALVMKVLLKGFTPAKFICVDHYDDIFKNFDCLKKARPFTVQQCDNGKCENENDATTILAQKADKLYAEGQYDELKILFTNNCNFFNCTCQCQKPIIKKSCDSRITKLVLNDLIGTSLKNSKDILKMVNKQDVWPEQCDNVIKTVTH